MPALPSAVHRLAGLATVVARAVVADHLAPTLPSDHPLRAWSRTDEGGPRPWPALMVAPRCLVSVAGDAGRVVDAFSEVASAAGMRVERLVGRDGIPVCVVRERHPDAWDVAGMLTGDVDWSPVLGTAVNVRGFALAAGGCVLEVDVEYKGGDRTLAREFAGVLERFAATSAAAGVVVQVGAWVDRRPPRQVRLGPRRGGDARA
jgi:hypothetical protein